MVKIFSKGTFNKGKVAAIDMGSNSFHLVIADIDQSGHLQVIDSYKEVVRLGEALHQKRGIKKTAIDNAIKVLSTMKEICAHHDAPIRAVATHTVRIAANQNEFIRAIRQHTGIEVEVINGREEARLCFLGMRCGMPLDQHRVLGLDIGGGSTEIIIAKKNQIDFATSLNLGAVILTKRFFREKSTTDREIENLRDHLLTRLAPVTGEVAKHPYTLAVASSGTAKAIASIHSQFYHRTVLSDAAGYVFSAADLHLVVRQLMRLRNQKNIINTFELDHRRAEIILAGAIILQAITDHFKVREWKISGCALREGVAMDAYCGYYGQALPHFDDIRQKSIQHFSMRLGVQQPYAEHVRTLAQCIYEQLENHFFSQMPPQKQEQNREILNAAALLCEAGKFLDFRGYHKHSHYLIVNSSLLGFSQEDKYLIGHVARFSRKSLATDKKAPDCVFLDNNEERVKILSSCLRLAKTLNRTREARVKDVQLQFAPGLLHINAFYQGQELPKAEQQVFLREKGVLSKVFGLDVHLHLRQLHQEAVLNR